MASPEISVEELATRLAAAGDAGLLLIDVREVDEYHSGHVPGARLVVLGTVPDNIDAFRGEGPAHVICRSGARSMRACEFLAGHGIDAVNIAGGTMAWQQSGRAVVTGDSPS
jgi:rhodanese-related sulfurtransferase